MTTLHQTNTVKILDSSTLINEENIETIKKLNAFALFEKGLMTSLDFDDIIKDFIVSQKKASVNVKVSHLNI